MSADGVIVIVGPGADRRVRALPESVPRLSQWSGVCDIVAEKGYNSCTFITSPATGGRAGHPLCALWGHRFRRGHTSDRRGDTDG